jgi:hypothetical protein
MSFKDFLNRDISSVFMNTEEYAESVYLDIGTGAKEITVSIDSEPNTHNSNLDELDRTAGEIYFFVSKSEFMEKFGEIPRSGDALRFNTVPCTVIKVTEPHGMLAVTLAFSA